MIERTYYQNGKIESEVEIEQGIISGTSRRWYENGQLQEEICMEESRPCGLASRYSIDGKMTDVARFLRGSGWSRTFYEDGMLATEVASFRSTPHGQMFAFDEDGGLTVAKFFLLGKKKSESASRQKLRSSIQDLTSVSEDEVQLLLPAEDVETSPYKLSGAFDIMSWLARSSRQGIRTIGEFNDRSESVRYLREVLESGVLRVLAEEDRLENDAKSASISSVYFVLSSENEDCRRRSFDFINAIESENGYEISLDNRQRAVHVELGPW